MSELPYNPPMNVTYYVVQTQIEGKCWMEATRRFTGFVRAMEVAIELARRSPCEPVRLISRTTTIEERVVSDHQTILAKL